jgi:hypothetical protein
LLLEATVNFIDQLNRAFEDLLERIRASFPQGSVLNFRMVGRLNQVEEVVSFGRYPLDTLTAEQLANVLLNRIQSNQFLMSDRIVISVTQILVQGVAGIRKGNARLKLPGYGVVPIFTSDGYCVARCIVLDELRRQQPQEYNNASRYPRILDRHLQQHISAFPFLYQAPEQDPQSFPRLEAALNIHIRLLLWFGDSRTLTTIYPSSKDPAYPYKKDDKPIVYLIGNGTLTHVDYAFSIKGFLPKGRIYCPWCFCSSDTKKVHSCPGTCRLCNVSFSEGVERCSVCHTRLCESCRPLHQCKKCKKCDRYLLFPSEKHDCAGLCVCGEDSHSGPCPMKGIVRQPLETPKWLVYDFECCEDEQGKHHPYLCIIHMPFSWQCPEYETGTHKGEPIARLEHSFEELLEEFAENKQEAYTWVFYGLDQMNRVAKFFMHRCWFRYTAWAHNGRAYDHILVRTLITMSENEHSVDDLRRGRKFLQMKYSNGLVFKDFLNFMPRSLAECAKAFQLDLQKDCYPHKWLTLEKQKQVEAQDSRPWMRPRATLENFFEITPEVEEWCSKSNDFCPKKDAIFYCERDVMVLTEALRSFRFAFCKLTDNVTDGMKSVSLPSAMMTDYLTRAVPDKTLFTINSFELRRKRLCEEWALVLSFPRENGIQLLQVADWVFEDQHGRRYLYEDCYRFGCVQCTSSEAYNISERKSFARCREDVLDISNIYARIRSHDWEIERLTIPEDVRAVIEGKLGLVPRDAYKGGMVEVYAHMVDGPIQMSDIVSQYPSIMLGETTDPFSQEKTSWYIPTGKPIVLRGALQESEFQTFLDQGYEGIAKVQIYPDKSDWCPLLGFYIGDEVVYPVCKICAINRTINCEHNGLQSSWIGTWTMVELREAKRNGARICSLIEAWVYPTKSKTLFRNYLIPFVKAKTVNKRQGLVDRCTFTEKGEETVKFLRDLGCSVDQEEFTDNPALREVAKLMMNSFTGKWGQKENVDTVKTYFNDPVSLSECASELRKSTNYIEQVHIFDEQVEVHSKNRMQTTMYLKKQDLIIAYITASGRVLLNRIVRQLGKNNVLYCDTDSVFHRAGVMRYTPGFRFGDLELELPAASRFTALGRKSYSYELPDGTVKVKQKGVSLKCLADRERFSPEEMRRHIVERTDYIEVSQPRIRTEQEEDGNLVKRTRVEPKKIRMLWDSLKRYPIVKDDELLTVPFGYKVN